MLSLAMSMHSGKGIYALLLGSGVSKGTGIPTGWDIVLDLIRKLAVLKGETAEPDPEAWYRSLAGVQPDYSDILDEITKSSAERGQLLRSYFEPTEDERQNGQKLPTSAHRAIAGLVAKGYIRVIVTTNFGRLMEQALVDAGVQPTVISTSDAVRGAPGANSLLLAITFSLRYASSYVNTFQTMRSTTKHSTGLSTFWRSFIATSGRVARTLQC